MINELLNKEEPWLQSYITILNFLLSRRVIKLTAKELYLDR